MSHTNTLQQFFTKNTAGILLCLGHRHSGMVFRQSRPCSRRAGLLHPYRHDRHPVFKKEGSV